ncbi:MAG: acyl-CoA dehydrogenase family protein [Chloroflexi bacterium]|uniref:Acyl-CoA dehydrogenase family protein n=1 Tax=Candidatus Chlorohelix allophototropha TaxID=3003348 RepID=A0A8T7M3Q8_9CHLR|nr:acyl-CoA dehydrogenase family protein [Chloroflexota bacterium]WJW66093.1 acyl-CoA dehydrogenase family protein [Chloroflexota bacterium L227-S17]
MIDFEIPASLGKQLQILEQVALNVMRPASRHFDVHEHDRPWDYIKLMWDGGNNAGYRGRAGSGDLLSMSGGEGGEKVSGPKIRNLALMYTVEMLSYGDCGLYLSTAGGALGAAAVEAAGTPEQRERFLTRFKGGEPKWGAMAMTEPQAGSDTANIRTTAKLTEDGKEWILNGEKIFVTNGLMAAQESPGIVVVWATIAPGTGRAGMRAFVVEGNTPGMTVARLEKKHGIRASDTAALTFADCRIPYDNIIGSPELAKAEGKDSKGFAGAMKTFDATRPLVAASAIGVGRAALDFTKDFLFKQGVTIRYDAPPNVLTAVERDVMRMEAQLRAAWLLTIRAAWQMDIGISNSLEASMCKVKAGEAVTWVTQKAVELLGAEGYDCKLLVEKWMRDGKINDLYEGTGQINRLVVARRMLGYSSKEL